MAQSLTLTINDDAEALETLNNVCIAHEYTGEDTIPAKKAFVSNILIEYLRARALHGERVTQRETLEAKYAAISISNS